MKCNAPISSSTTFKIPPFCIISSVKMYIFYRFIDIYRFSIASPPHVGFYILTNALPIFKLPVCGESHQCSRDQPDRPMQPSCSWLWLPSQAPPHPSPPPHPPLCLLSDLAEALLRGKQLSRAPAPHVLAAGRTSWLLAQLYQFQRADACRASSNQRLPCQHTWV